MKRKIDLTIQTYHGEGDGLDGAIVGQDPNLHVFIDEDISQDEQAAAFLHEMLHLWHNDKADPRPLEVIELERRQELRRVAKILAGDNNSGRKPYGEITISFTPEEFSKVSLFSGIRANSMEEYIKAAVLKEIDNNPLTDKESNDFWDDFSKKVFSNDIFKIE